MALRSCFQCKTPVSTHAEACPKCGSPVREKNAQKLALLGYLFIVTAVIAGTVAFLRRGEPVPEVSQEPRKFPSPTGAMRF